MLQHRALVDRALVGDFAAIDRQRRIEQHRAGDPGRRARGARQRFWKPLAKRVADQRIGRRRSEIVRRQRRIDQAAAIEIEHDQRRDFVAVDAGDHDVAHQRRAGRDEARAQRADADPGAAGELEILGNAAVEIEAGVEIVGIGRLERIAEFVKAFFVEGRRGQFRLAPIARRDVRPLGANFQLAVVRHQLCVIARAREGRHGRSGWCRGAPT